MAADDLLLDDEPERDDRILPIDQASLRHRLAYLNPRSVHRATLALLGEGRQEFRFRANVFPNVAYDCLVTPQPTVNAYDLFEGKVRGDEYSRVVMTKRGGLMTVDIWTDDREFQIVPVGDDLYLVEEVNLRAEPDCASRKKHRSSRRQKQSDGEDDEVEEPRMRRSITPVTITVLVIYESSVVRQAGSVAAAERAIDLMVANLNAALRASLTGTGVAVEVQLLGPLQHDFPSLSSSHCTAWTQLRASTLVQRWRRDMKADLVSIIRVTQARSCAACLQTVGGNASSAFSSVEFSQARARHSFAHELGHNLGCPHDIDNADCIGINPNRRTGIHWGYHFLVGRQEYGTLMSYPGIRILQYSNPNVSYRGVPTGKATANNAAAIAKTAANIARYR